MGKEMTAPELPGTESASVFHFAGCLSFLVHAPSAGAFPGTLPILPMLSTFTLTLVSGLASADPAQDSGYL